MCLAGFAIIVSQICSFFYVLLVGSLDLLIFLLGLQNFFGFVGFLVWIGLLDLGIHLDGKKIVKKM